MAGGVVLEAEVSGVHVAGEAGHRHPGQPHQPRHLQPRALSQQDDVLTVVVRRVRGVREVLQVATSQ